jgi:hypothetical protein
MRGIKHFAGRAIGDRDFDKVLLGGICPLPFADFSSSAVEFQRPGPVVESVGSKIGYCPSGSPIRKHVRTRLHIKRNMRIGRNRYCLRPQPDLGCTPSLIAWFKDVVDE